MVQVQIEKLLDHSGIMFLAFQIYHVDQESILRFASKTALAGEGIALVSPTLVSNLVFCVAVFFSDRRGIACRVPKGTSFVVEAKGPGSQSGRQGIMDGDDLN